MISSVLFRGLSLLDRDLSPWRVSSMRCLCKLFTCNLLYDWDIFLMMQAMSRSVKVAPEYIPRVKQALNRNGFPNICKNERTNSRTAIRYPS